LNWLQHDTRIFNVGNKRRKVIAQVENFSAAQELTQSSSDGQNADFFGPENVNASRLREQLAMETLDEVLDHLIQGGGSVSLFDATNSTVERRNSLVQRIRLRSSKVQIMFLESQCFDSAVSYSSKSRKVN
jgi:6-phosphofructo-2-kinase